MQSSTGVQALGTTIGVQALRIFAAKVRGDKSMAHAALSVGHIFGDREQYYRGSSKHDPLDSRLAARILLCEAYFSLCLQEHLQVAHAAILTSAALRPASQWPRCLVHRYQATIG